MGEDAMIAEQARRNGEAVLRSAALAAHAKYNDEDDTMRIVLTSGVRVDIPVAMIQGLAEAPRADRHRVEVSGIGHGLYWPTLDLDLSVPELLSGVFGTRAWMDRVRASRAGRTSSAAKAEASRRNGAKGGRPRKAVD